MNRKRFWVLAIGYSVMVFLLNNILETALGEFLMQLSYFALAFVIIWYIYNIIKFFIKKRVVQHKKN